MIDWSLKRIKFTWHKIFNFVIAETTLILGLGNEILSDDRIGLLLVNDLRRKISDPDMQFATACTGGLEIMELIKDFRNVVIIDAIRTEGGKPGDVYHFTPADFRETLNLSNLHDVNFLTALRLGKMLDLNLPENLHLIGIEIMEDTEFSEKLTPSLEEKYQEILEEVCVLIRKSIDRDKK